MPEDMKDKHPVIGGREADFTYGDCQAEMDTVNRAFMEVMTEGDANGSGLAYPIPTYAIDKDFDWSAAVQHGGKVRYAIFCKL